MDKQILFKINGMNCDGCAATVQRALASVKGVNSAEVHLSSKSAIVYLGENPPSVEKLTEAVKKAGFEATAG